MTFNPLYFCMWIPPFLLYVNPRTILNASPQNSNLIFLSFFFFLLLMNPSRDVGSEGGVKGGLPSGGRGGGGWRRGRRASGSSASQIRVLGEKSTIHDSLHVSCWASEMATILAKRILATVGSLGSLSETLMPDQNLANEDRSVCVHGRGDGVFPPSVDQAGLCMGLRCFC